MAAELAPAAPPVALQPSSPTPAPAPAPVPAGRRGEGGAVDHMRAVYVRTPATLIGYVLGVVVVCGLFWDLAPPASLWGWVGTVTVFWMLRLAHYRRYWRQRKTADEATLLAW